MRAFSVFLTALIFVTSANGNDPADKGVLTPFQNEVISYFKEIALGYEYGTAAPITRKWTKPMHVFLDGNPSSAVRAEVEAVVEELNSLISDGFHIKLVETKEESNMHMFIGNVQDYLEIYPQDKDLTVGNTGVFTVFWNKSNELFKGRILIKTSAGITEQRHAVREELTQCLGLGRDAVTHPDSIFQLNYVTFTSYAPIDRELIRLLYHPKMKIGLSSVEVESLLTSIFLSEQELLTAK